MKEVKINPSKGMFFCDFYLCSNVSEIEIGTPTAPTGDRFRVCKEHYTAMKNEMGIKTPVTETVKEEIKEENPIQDELKSVKQELYKRGGKNLFAE